MEWMTEKHTVPREGVVGEAVRVAAARVAGWVGVLLLNYYYFFANHHVIIKSQAHATSITLTFFHGCGRVLF